MALSNGGLSDGAARLDWRSEKSKASGICGRVGFVESWRLRVRAALTRPGEKKIS